VKRLLAAVLDFPVTLTRDGFSREIPAGAIPHQ